MGLRSDDSRDELMGTVRFRLQNEHPVMAALATKIETGSGTDGLFFRVVFDGPALPEKQTFEGSMHPEDVRFEQVAVLLRECEKQVAAAIRKAR